MLSVRQLLFSRVPSFTVLANVEHQLNITFLQCDLRKRCLRPIPPDDYGKSALMVMTLVVRSCALQGDVWAEAKKMFEWHCYMNEHSSIYEVTDWAICQVRVNMLVFAQRAH